MKVLMVGWELPPHHSGGLGVACLDMSKQLVKDGVNMAFVVPYRADHGHKFMPIISATEVSVEEFRLLGSAYGSIDKSVKRFAKQTKYSGIIAQTDAYANQICRAVESLQFDVIHAHDWLTVSAALRLKQATGKPLVLHIHATEYDRAGDKRGNELVHAIEYAGLQAADQIIAVSHITKNILVDRYGISPDKINVVHNKLDISIYDEAVNSDQYPALTALKEAGYKVVSSIGRITIQKGLWQLLGAFKLVVDRRPKTLLLLAGNGDMTTELQDRAAQLGIASNVLFTNSFVAGQRWRQAFMIGDCFVMSSVSEPFGIAPLEAALFGTPSIVSRQSGVSESMKNLLCVDYYDEVGLANKILAVVDNPGLRQTLAENAYQEVLGHTWDRSTPRIRSVYEAVKA